MEDELKSMGSFFRSFVRSFAFVCSSIVAPAAAAAAVATVAARSLLPRMCVCVCVLAEQLLACVRYPNLAGNFRVIRT